jgi:transposase-like protein
MKEYTQEKDFCTEKSETCSLLEQIARKGARKMLQQALELEVEEYIQAHRQDTDSSGRRAVVRNGYHPSRCIVSGIGPLPIRQPRVDDRKQPTRFASTILPRYLRRMPSINNLIPYLYLKGISSNDFPQALRAILGEGVKGLSPANIVRLKKIWEDEYQSWTKRDLSAKHYVYIWADGIYFQVRLDEESFCILVIMEADAQGNKELIAISDGYRESKISWQEMLLDLKERGLQKMPKLAVGDGALGFWAALAEVFPQTRRQRCWVHKTANILDKLPKAIQPRAKSLIHEMYQAQSKKDALGAYDHFLASYRDKYPKAVECLTKDSEDLFTFYDFPAVHWMHIRTTNPIESTFATVRLRTKRTKGCGSRKATLTMVFKLAQEAQKNWRRLRGYKMIPLVLENKKFRDGELVEKVA